MIGKWHMGHSGHPRPHFDYWLSFDGQGVYNDPVFNIDGDEMQIDGYTTDLLTDHAIHYIDDIPTDEPYFVMLSHKAVHEPFKPAPRHRKSFGAEVTDPQPESWLEDFADKPDWQRGSAHGTFVGITGHGTGRRNPSLRRSRKSPGQTSRSMCSNYAVPPLSMKAWAVFSTCWRTGGHWRTTLIIFASDNGLFPRRTPALGQATGLRGKHAHPAHHGLSGPY
jgi:hypothetical protein